MNAVETVSTQCCVAGGGPAGMMLGYLLARSGVEVLVLEKHADFLRDFRGDTVHPSTLQVMHELGLLEDFLKQPHQKVERLGGQIGKAKLILGDFTHLPTVCKFIALMPQWDFLNFLAAHARKYPTFKLRMESEVTGLREANGTITGIDARSKSGTLSVNADLIVGADGRTSIVRQKAGLKVIDRGSAIDVLWMRISKGTGDPGQTFGHVEAGKMLVMIDRADYWQCAFVIPKGAAEKVRSLGIEAFRSEILEMSPYLGERVRELKSWDDVKLLTVKVDRLRCWHREGLLCIGDSAHAMSPIGGVGINLAIQDAVAAANILAGPLRQGRVTTDHLQRVQERRQWPTEMTQGMQVFIQNRLITRVLGANEEMTLAWPFRLVRRFPVLARIPARLIGVGFRPEHVRTAPFTARW